MISTASPSPHDVHPDGLLARLVSRAAGAAGRRPRTTILLWLALVAGCIAGGAATGTQTLSDSEAGVGDSARADAALDEAGLHEPAVERVLVRAHDPAAMRVAASALEARLKPIGAVAGVRGPAAAATLTAAGGRGGLVEVTLRGDPDAAADRVAAIERAVAATAREHRRVTFQQAGSGSIENAFDAIVKEDLERAELFSVPITLLILALAFGALVAASVPLLLGLTAVAAALGALGAVSQLVAIDESASSLVVLVGLAVGVDYSLFYIRREREERRAGREPHAAHAAAAATVGRAIAVSGLVVVVALSGLLVTGLAVFKAMALATMLVVAIAVVGSLTVLPAVLALLGNRIDRGRIPGLRRGRANAAAGGVWAKLAGVVTRRPLAAAITAGSVLAALAVPALGMRISEPGADSLPEGTPAIAALHAIERAFPGAPRHLDLVVTGAPMGTPAAQRELAALGRRAAGVTGGRGAVAVKLSRDARTARVAVPLPDRGVQHGRDTVTRLRERVAPTAAAVAPGATALVTGGAARDADFTARLDSATPIVIAFVLGLAFLLLLAAFGSAALALAMIGLNLLSIGAAYGVLTAVFQNAWAESLLGFSSSGSVVSWVPLFLFVILFGLSMDYTVLVLERIREGRRAGLTPRAAAAAGVGATGGAVTSAAIVMVAVFAIFASLRMLEMKQLGVGLAAAVLLDATIVRGVALPATVALLGERGWKVRRRRVPRLTAAGGWDDAGVAPATAAQGTDGH